MSRVSMRMMVRRSAERAMVPREEEVERVRAAWIVWVEVGGGMGASGLQSQGGIVRHNNGMT